MNFDQNTAKSGWWESIARTFRNMHWTAWLTIVTLVIAYGLTSIALIRTMEHSSWLILLSTLSFGVIQWTLWVEYRPPHLKASTEPGLFRDPRFMGSLGGAVNFLLLGIGTSYLKGSLPFIAEYTVLGSIFFGMLVLLIPLSACACCYHFPRKTKS